MADGILEQLERNRAELISAVDGVSDAQAIARPADGGWSALECLEHVIVVERRFFALLARAERQAEPRTDAANEMALRSRLADREVKVQAPEAVLPTGRLTAVAEGVAEFNDVRDNVIRFAKRNETDLYRLSATHAKFGVMNGVELLLFMVGHASRHAEQMRVAARGSGAASAAV